MAVETYRYHLEWPGVALRGGGGLIPRAYQWSKSADVEGQFYHTIWLNTEDHMQTDVFKFSLPEVAVHFRLMFGGRVIGKDSLRLPW